MWKTTNEDLPRKVELLTREKAEREEELICKMEEVVSDAKASVLVAVWEAKIHLAEDLKNAGSWDVVGWR